MWVLLPRGCGPFLESLERFVGFIFLTSSSRVCINLDWPHSFHHMAFELNEDELKELTDAFKQTPKDELPRTTTGLQEFVDKYVNVASTVATVIDAALDDDKQLTQEVLESAGVMIRPTQDLSRKEIELHMAGLWDRSLDVQQYEDTKNSYIGSKFILWYVYSMIDCIKIQFFVEGWMRCFLKPNSCRIGWFKKKRELTTYRLLIPMNSRTPHKKT